MRRGPDLGAAEQTMLVKHAPYALAMAERIRVTSPANASHDDS